MLGRIRTASSANQSAGGQSRTQEWKKDLLLFGSERPGTVIPRDDRGREIEVWDRPVLRGICQGDSQILHQPAAHGVPKVE